VIIKELEDFVTFVDFSKTEKFSITIKNTDISNMAIWSITSEIHNIVPVGKVKEVVKQGETFAKLK